MANGAAIGIGIFFLIIAGVGFVYPVSDGYTIVQVDDICKSGLGQLGQLFSASGQQGCQQVKLMYIWYDGSRLLSDDIIDAYIELGKLWQVESMLEGSYIYYPAGTARYVTCTNC